MRTGFRLGLRSGGLGGSYRQGKELLLHSVYKGPHKDRSRRMFVCVPEAHQCNTFTLTATLLHDSVINTVINKGNRTLPQAQTNNEDELLAQRSSSH